jgi:hypothetical protein
VFIVLPLHAEAPARGIPPQRSVAAAAPANGSLRCRGFGFDVAREAPIDSALPAAQGRAAMFGACKALKMKESGNHAFRFP